MNLREMPLEVISHDSILGRSMYNVNKDAHDRLAKEMKEWERKKGNKVYVAKIGESAEYSPLKAESIARGAKNGGSSNKHRAIMKNADRPIDLFPDNSVKRNKTKRKSNHQNLSLRPNGKFEVKVGSVYLGTFSDENEAVKVRDSYRSKTGLPPAEY